MIGVVGPIARLEVAHLEALLHKPHGAGIFEVFDKALRGGMQHEMDVRRLAGDEFHKDVEADLGRGAYRDVVGADFRCDDAHVAFVVGQGNGWTLGFVMTLIADAEGDGRKFAWVEMAVAVACRVVNPNELC